MCHDVLPWDDDIDIMVAYRLRFKMERLLLQMEPEYRLVNHTTKVYRKFFLKSTPKTWIYEWAWPFIDVSFYDENSTHIWEYGHLNEPHRIYPKNIVFPIHRRPLGGLWIPSPKDTRAFLVQSIKGSNKTFMCGQQGWAHKKESKIEDNLLVSCSGLELLYPTVYRYPSKGGVLETLKLGQRTFYSCLIQEPEYSVTTGPLTFDLIDRESLDVNASSATLKSVTISTYLNESGKATVNIPKIVDEWTRAPKEEHFLPTRSYQIKEGKAEEQNVTTAMPKTIPMLVSHAKSINSVLP